jgi:hypothetical protein
MGQDLVPKGRVVKGFLWIRMGTQDFSFEAEYLLFHSLPSWRGTETLASIYGTGTTEVKEVLPRVLKDFPSGLTRPYENVVRPPARPPSRRMCLCRSVS